MRKYFALWAQLIGNNETGLGWDHNKTTVQADNSWWEEKIKVHNFCNKFLIIYRKKFHLFSRCITGKS